VDEAGDRRGAVALDPRLPIAGAAAGHQPSELVLEESKSKTPEAFQTRW
jgi:hypothetical protein